MSYNVSSLLVCVKPVALKVFNDQCIGVELAHSRHVFIRKKKFLACEGVPTRPIIPGFRSQVPETRFKNKRVL